MTFRDIKQNYPVYILDKRELKITQSKAISVSVPHPDTNRRTGKTEMVVDVTIEINGKTPTYAIPENLSVSYDGDIVLSTSKQGLSDEVEAMVVSADQILASIPLANRIKEMAPSLRAELNPAYKEKQETEMRFGKIEGSISEMKTMMQQQQKMMENFIKEFKS